VGVSEGLGTENLPVLVMYPKAVSWKRTTRSSAANQKRPLPAFVPPAVRILVKMVSSSDTIRIVFISLTG